MQFEQVLGQARLKKNLIDAHNNERLPHAIIFKGPFGRGTFPLGLALTTFLLCKDKKDTGSCGVCSNCKKVQKLIHPDVHFTFPVFGSKSTSDDFLEVFRKMIIQNPYASYPDWISQLDGANKQGNINTETTRRIISKAGLKSFSGREKIFIIWKAEYLQKEGNRLLKLIEEPPPNTYFFFFAENTNQILNTILSRCQLVSVPPIEDEAIQDHFESSGLEAEKVSEISAVSEGDLNTANQFSENADSTFGKALLDWFRLCFNGNPVEIMAWVDIFAKQSRDYKRQFYEYGLFFLRELNGWKNSEGQRGLRLSKSERPSAQKLAGLIKNENMFEIIDIFVKSTLYIERNANDKILFFNNALKLHKLLRNKV